MRSKMEVNHVERGDFQVVCEIKDGKFGLSLLLKDVKANRTVIGKQVLKLQSNAEVGSVWVQSV